MTYLSYEEMDMSTGELLDLLHDEDAALLARWTCEFSFLYTLKSAAGAVLAVVEQNGNAWFFQTASMFNGFGHFESALAAMAAAEARLAKESLQ